MEIALIDDAREIEIDTDIIGLDIETSPRHEFLQKGMKNIEPDPRLVHMVLAQVAVGDVVYVLRDHFGSLQRILENKRIVKVIHNAVFEYKFFKYEFDIDIRNLWDTMIARAIIDSGRRPQLGLDDVTEELLGIKLDKTVRQGFIDGSRITRKMIEYGAMDAWVLPKLYHILKEKLYPGAEKVLQLEHMLVPAVADLELNGAKIDQDAWKRQADIVHEKLLTTRKKLLSMLPVTTRRITIMGDAESDVNLNSRDQLLPLFERAGIDLPDLKAETITAMATKSDHPLLRLYANYSKLQKAESTYGYSFLENINPVTGRVHQHIKQLETRTGRLAATPNLMNIPKRGGTMYRECFVSEEDRLIASADFHMQELGILAQIARCKRLITAFHQGVDVHWQMGKMLFKDESIPAKGPQRDAAKTLNFAVVYGMGVVRLALNLKCSVNEARELLARHRELLPEVYEWMAAMTEFAVAHGYVETLIGRRRYLDTTVEGFEREAGNTPVQGSAADMTKLALVIARTKGLRLVNCVHDELITEPDDYNAEDSLEVLQFSMMMAANKMVNKVEIVADGYIAPRWSPPKKG